MEACLCKNADSLVALVCRESVQAEDLYIDWNGFTDIPAQIVWFSPQQQCTAAPQHGVPQMLTFQQLTAWPQTLAALSANHAARSLCLARKPAALPAGSARQNRSYNEGVVQRRQLSNTRHTAACIGHDRLHLQACRAGSTVSQPCLQLCSLSTCCQYLSLQAVALFLTPAALSSQCFYVQLLMTTILLNADKSELLKRCFSLPAMQVQVRS